MYSTGDYIQYRVIAKMEKNLKKNIQIHICVDTIEYFAVYLKHYKSTIPQLKKYKEMFFAWFV